jgi:hypothetical protein
MYPSCDPSPENEQRKSNKTMNLTVFLLKKKRRKKNSATP